MSRTLVLLALVAAGCDGGEGFSDARPVDATPPTGTFSLSWTVTDTMDGTPVDCDDANASTVSITVREEGAGSGYVEVYNCSSMLGTSRPIAPGTYVLGFSLRGASGEIATAPGLPGVVVAANQDTPVGAHDFSVVATGGLSFRISTTTTTNCDPLAAMGGGVDTMAITLTKGGTCVAVDWTIGAGTYMATCPPPPRACIENDVDISATGLDSGRYQLSAVGNIGADPCWLGAREARVPTGGVTGMTVLGLAYQPVIVGCPPMP